MWKVRFVGEDGDLCEASFSGTLAELAQTFSAHEVIVVQRPMPATTSGPGDSAKGESEISVEKG